MPYLRIRGCPGTIWHIVKILALQGTHQNQDFISSSKKSNLLHLVLGNQWALMLATLLNILAAYKCFHSSNVNLLLLYYKNII